MIINGINWTIEFVKPNSHKLRRADGSITIGVTNARTRTISIADNLSNNLFIKVLTHEVTHAICFSYGYLFDVETEEILADFIANHGLEIIDLVDAFMTQFISRNA